MMGRERQPLESRETVCAECSQSWDGGWQEFADQRRGCEQPSKRSGTAETPSCECVPSLRLPLGSWYAQVDQMSLRKMQHGEQEGRERLLLKSSLGESALQRHLMKLLVHRWRNKKAEIEINLHRRRFHRYHGPPLRWSGY